MKIFDTREDFLDIMSQDEESVPYRSSEGRFVLVGSQSTIATIGLRGPSSEYSTKYPSLLIRFEVLKSNLYIQQI
jgi:hypothetical protein